MSREHFTFGGIAFPVKRVVVPCPLGMREEMRRALLERLRELQREIDNCEHRAREAGFNQTANCIATLVHRVPVISDFLREERSK